MMKSISLEVQKFIINTFADGKKFQARKEIVYQSFKQ